MARKGDAEGTGRAVTNLPRNLGDPIGVILGPRSQPITLAQTIASLTTPVAWVAPIDRAPTRTVGMLFITDDSSAEGIEPDVSLRPLTDGREVIEDYRALQLSLRAHPLTFVRDELARRGVTRCVDLAKVRDGRHVEVAGIIFVRQKPGSAKGVLFITIEDEAGIANGILQPDRFEAQRRTVMSASMIGMKGRLQKEGEVIHVICDRIIDHGDLLTRVGEMSFPHRTGRGDGARHAGAPDRGDVGGKVWSPEPRNC